jgi:hypothetical protein
MKIAFTNNSEQYAQKIALFFQVCFFMCHIFSTLIVFECDRGFQNGKKEEGVHLSGLLNEKSFFDLLQRVSGLTGNFLHHKHS